MFLKVTQNIRPSFFLQSQIRRKGHLSLGEIKAEFNEIYKPLSEYDEKYNYLEKSVIPTLHFQWGLPRLPIPKLEDTCRRYLNAQKPILTSDKFSRTSEIVESFKTNEGVKLQKALKKMDSKNKHTSYISKPWFDMYLTDRTPLPINYNPAIVFSNSSNPINYTQLHRATNMIISSVRFMNSLRANLLSPEVYHLVPEKLKKKRFENITSRLPQSVAWFAAYLLKAFPLDMSQYSSLFNSTRIPQQGKDVLKKNESGKHILVLKNGHFFTFDVINEEGRLRSPEDIYTCLSHIVGLKLTPDSESVGLMTTENRDVWANVREHISSISQKNVDTLEKIDSALFVVCLDSKIVGFDRVKILQNFLHGDGSNRWFDKSFSLIFSSDAVASVNFEHSWGDGVAILRYFLEVHKDSNDSPFVDHRTKLSNLSGDNFVKKIEFDLDDKSKHHIQEAKKKYDAFRQTLQVNVAENRRMGKRDCIKKRISPDSFMQLSFQVAYYKVYGKFVPTYESCSTAAFKHGRTETLRPCTVATKEFTERLLSANRPIDQELLALMKNCSSLHGKLTKEAAMGQGFDRHLFGLKYIAQELGDELPELFKDEAYLNINRNIISTSTLGAEAVLMGGFGPVVPNGLGVGYSILDGVCGSVVTSYPGTKGAEFAECLNETLFELGDIILKVPHLEKV